MYFCFHYNWNMMEKKITLQDVILYIGEHFEFKVLDGKF